jgi:U3 small nucleolar RNA-associated protein 13
LTHGRCSQSYNQPDCQTAAGADGLLKLWDSRTGANTNTFEGHEDRLWGLAASAAPAESLVATGGGDSRVVIWRDATAAKAAEAEAAEESLVLKQQELSNALAVSTKSWRVFWCLQPYQAAVDLLVSGRQFL